MSPVVVFMVLKFVRIADAATRRKENIPVRALLGVRRQLKRTNNMVGKTR